MPDVSDPLIGGPTPGETVATPAGALAQRAVFKRPLSPLVRERGNQMLAAMSAFAGRTYMAVAVTMALGGAGAASTLPGSVAVGSPTHLVTDESVFTRTAPGAPLTPSAAWGSLFSYSSGAGGIRGSAGGDGPIFSTYVTNCTAIEISCYSGGTLARALRLRVSGQWAQEPDFVTSAWGGGRRYIKFTFASPVTGVLDIAVPTTLVVLGANIAADSAVAPDTSQDIKAEMWWDSYAAGGAAWSNSLWAAPARLYMESMGVHNPVPQGRGGQGWDNLVDGRNILQRIGLDAGYALPDLHFAALANSVNDRENDIVRVAANQAAGAQALLDFYPDSWIIAHVGFDTAVNGFPPGALDTIYEAVASVKNDRLLLVDGRSWPKVSTTGTLPNGLPQDSSDGVHQGPNERALIAQNYMKERTRTALLEALA